MTESVRRVPIPGDGCLLQGLFCTKVRLSILGDVEDNDLLVVVAVQNVCSFARKDNCAVVANITYLELVLLAVTRRYAAV